MFCRNCGKEIAEGKKFCGACGTPVPAPKPESAEAPVAEATPVAEAAYSAPAMEDSVTVQVMTEQPPAPEVQHAAPEQQYNNYKAAAPVYPEPKVSKRKYLKTKASTGIKIASISARIVGLICLVVCVAMFAQLIFGSVFDMPILEYAGVDMEFDKDTIRTELDKLQMEKDKWQAEKTRLSDELENLPDVKEKEEVEKALEEAQEMLEIAQKALDFCNDFLDTCSIASVHKLGDVLEDAPEKIEYDPEEVNGIVTIVENIVLVFGGYCLFIILLTLLAVLFRNNIFTVLAFILGIGFPMLFSGAIYAVLFAVSYVLLFALQFAVNHSYRKYKKAVA